MKIETLHQCRFCKDRARYENLVKYGSRNYAHFECWNGDLESLPTHQVARFPVALLVERDQLELAQKIIRA